MIKIMSNYTANGIRDIVKQKELERYYGEITLYFKAGKISILEYRMKQKAGEEQPVAGSCSCTEDLN